MVEIIAPIEQDEAELDLCWGCRLFWFDPGELEALPKMTKLSKEGESLVGALEEQLRAERSDSRVADFLRRPASGSVRNAGTAYGVYEILKDLAMGAFGPSCRS